MVIEKLKSLEVCSAYFKITQLLNSPITQSKPNAATGKDAYPMGGFNLQDLMSKAKAQYESLQKKMQETVVEASSGGGTVTAKMDGRKQLLSLKIDPEAVKAGDVEMLQDLVLAAINEAARKIDAQMQSTVGGMLGGLGIGGL
ncbi:MAG TPA: YbaB/EbfC family nucleoid-associated protein [Candidatus Sulfotelmatobacter sp.]